jgi:cobalt-zinc-cadmium efflux system membrane fusion protein
MQTYTRERIMRWLQLIVLAASFGWVVQPVYGETSAAGDHKNEAAHGEEGHITLTPKQIKHAGIEIDRVGPASIHETLPLYGKVVPNAQRQQAVSARFPGVITQVTKQVGDAVQRGETLATVESNESLKSYPVVASLDGVVAERSANVGEQTNGRTLFLVGDYSTVWVDLAVFPSDLPKVHVGQSVRIESRDATVTGEGEIIAILPVGSSTNQTTTARVLLNNADRQWIPGHFVTAAVFLSESEVATTVQDEAVQLIDGQTIVFVAGDEGFEPRPVSLGRSDGQVIEVLKGLKAGEAYVSTNSFTLKSELGKEDAEDGH